MNDKQTGKEDYLIKICGITFDVDNSKKLQFNNFEEKIRNYGKPEVIPALFSYKRIHPSNDSNIITSEEKKHYLPVCQKGIISNELEVFPFGYE